MGDRTREYYEHFLRVFADPRFSQGVDDFFWRNGYRFLNRPFSRRSAEWRFPVLRR